jgi:hypothetical protein
MKLGNTSTPFEEETIPHLMRKQKGNLCATMFTAGEIHCSTREAEKQGLNYFPPGDYIR